jgi:hypothetical protein
MITEPLSFMYIFLTCNILLAFLFCSCSELACLDTRPGKTKKELIKREPSRARARASNISQQQVKFILTLLFYGK